MTRTRGRRVPAIAVALAAGAVLAYLPAGWAGAAPDGYPNGVRVAPAALPRGADAVGLHTVGGSIVDGRLTVRTGLTGRLLLVGRADPGYVVITTDASGANRTLWRVRKDGGTVRLRDLGDGGDDARTSATGSRVSFTVPGRARTRVVVLRTSDGIVLGRQRYRGYLQVLDFHKRVLLSGLQPSRTLWYRPRTDTTEVAFHRNLWSADIERDRAVLPVRDPAGYDRTCLVYTRLSDLSRRRWRSCTDKPLAFSSPEGTRMVTTYIEADGLGTSLLQVRDAETAAVRATYRTAGYFGNVAWEDENSLLVMTWSKGRAAIVRINTGGKVVRVSRVARMPATGDALRWSFPMS